MVIKCWKDSGKWKIDERDASLISGLRTLIQDKADKYGVDYAVFVILYTDPLSVFAVFKEDKDRHQVVAHAVWGDTIPSKALKEKIITNACEEYFRFANTTEARAMRAMGNTLDGIITQLEGKNITADNMKEIGEISAKLPGWLESYKKLVAGAQIEEENVIDKVKGGGALSWAEQQAMKK